MARVSGLISGLDTDALIQELVAAYETKQQSYEKKQTKLGWKQEAWKSLNTKVYSFYTGALNTARFSSAYSAKKATISDSTKATVSASSDAVEGTQTLKINKLAKTAYLTGGVVNGTDGKLTANSTIGNVAGLDKLAGASIEVNGKNITFGKDTTINQFVAQLKDAGVNASFDATNQRFFISGKKSGVEGEFSITAANAGGITALEKLGLNATSTQDVKAYAANANMNVADEAKKTYTAGIIAEANNLLALWNDYVKYGTDSDYRTKLENQWNKQAETYQKNIDDILAWTGKDGGKKLSELLKKDGDNYAVDTGQYDWLDLEETDENKISEINQKLKDNGFGFTLDELKAQLTELNANTKAKNEIGDTKNKYQTEVGIIPADGQGANVEKIKKDIDTLTAQVGTLKELKLDDKFDTTLKDVLTTLEKGIEESETVDDFLNDEDNTIYKNLETQYQNEKDTNTEQLNQVLADIINSKKVTGLTVDNTDGSVTVKFGNKTVSVDEAGRLYDSDDKYLTVAADGTISEGDKNNAATIDSLYETALAGGNSTSSSGAVRVNGTDAEIELNGAIFTSNTNNFSINGLTITATGETTEAITLSTTTDIDGMYDSIKKLISGYNDILKEMNTLYYADSSKGYEPLTDDEKEAMSDDEIEKWEKKIKDSLLRRDDTLGNIMNGMKNVTAKSYEINGKTYSLSTFGIATSGYFSVNNEERGLFHIDGDKDDSTSSGNKDKLRAALATDSGSVIQFFQKLADDLYSDLTNRMKRTSLSSSYTLYNDKQLQKQYEEYDDIIDEWDDKIEKYTEKYVKQFTAMEKAMAQLQSSTSQLTGMLG